MSLSAIIQELLRAEIEAIKSGHEGSDRQVTFGFNAAELVWLISVLSCIFAGLRNWSQK